MVPDLNYEQHNQLHLQSIGLCGETGRIAAQIADDGRGQAKTDRLDANKKC